MCVIVRPTAASGRLASGVEAFRKYLELATGAKFEVIPDSRRPAFGWGAIHIGDTVRSRRTDLGLPELNYGTDRFPNLRGYVIKTLDRGTLIIRGATDAATLHGLVSFLERYVGVRQYWPGPPGWLGDVVPERRRLSLPRIDWRDWPYFYSATFSTGVFGEGGGPRLDFYRREVTLPCNENYHVWLPSQDHAASHPEYFALRAGRRLAPAPPDDGDSWQPCVSNSEVGRLMGDAVLDFFRRNPAAPGVNFSLNDGGGDCECENCRAWDGPREESGARGGSGDRYLRFANQVAEHVGREFPDRWIVHLAYGGARPVPAGVRPHPQVIPVLTVPGNTFATWEAWIAAGARHLGLYVHHDDAFFVLPKHDLGQMVRRIRHIVDSGRARVFYMEWHAQWPFGDIIPLVVSRLLWDPRQEVAAILDEYYRGFFGAAGPRMRAFHQVLEEGYQRWLESAGVPHPHGPDISSFRDAGTLDQFLVLSPAEAARARTELDLAAAAVPPGSREARRIGIVDRQFRLQELAVRWSWAARRLRDEPPTDLAGAEDVLADAAAVLELGEAAADYLTNVLDRPSEDAGPLFGRLASRNSVLSVLRSGQPTPEIWGSIQHGLEAADRVVRNTSRPAAWWETRMAAAAHAELRNWCDAARRRSEGLVLSNLFDDPGFEEIRALAPERLAVPGEIELDRAEASAIGIRLWFPERSAGKCVLSTNSHSGRRSLELISVRRASYSRVAPAVAGDRYRAGVWFRHNEGPVDYLFRVAFSPVKGTQPEIISLRVPRRPGEWQKLVLEAVAPPGARYISMGFRINNQTSASRCQIDDLSVSRYPD